MTNQVLPVPDCHSYLVLVQPALVALDIATSIADHLPGANVIVVQSLADADEALLSVDTIAMAFLGLAPATIKARGLADVIRKRGGVIVFIGDEAEEAAASADWTLLRRPFSSEGVLAAINHRRQVATATCDDACACACDG